MGFASHFRYCSDVAHPRTNKLCTMFGRLLGWYTVYTFSGTLASWRNFTRCKIHFTYKSCVLLYMQHYCTAFQQRTSAKLCGVVQEMKLRNFHTGCHLHSAGRPSRWASAHILVPFDVNLQHTVFQKTATCFLVITSANEHRFSQFFHCDIPQEIFYRSLKETSTSP